jgi:hypothetical protein
MRPQSVSTNRRLLAVDVRPHRLGYAIFETSERLLDFGVTRFDSPSIGAQRIAALVSRFAPTVLVLRNIARESTRNRPPTRAVMRLISRHARHSSIEVTTLSTQQVKIALAVDPTVTKHQIASLLACAFPELELRLPQPRKSWQTEPWNMLVFDAVALGVSYLASQNDEVLIQKIAVAKKSLFAGPSVA